MCLGLSGLVLWAHAQHGLRVGAVRSGGRRPDDVELARGSG
jgi:hypothetical protein